MKAEKIIKREDGSRVRIITSLRDSYSNQPIYESIVHVCGKGKRTWNGTYSDGDFSFRRLSMDERKVFINEKNLEYVTEQELHDAKLELWESIKP